MANIYEDLLDWYLDSTCLFLRVPHSGMHITSFDSVDLLAVVLNPFLLRVPSIRMQRAPWAHKSVPILEPLDCFFSDFFSSSNLFILMIHIAALFGNGAEVAARCLSMLLDMKSSSLSLFAQYYMLRITTCRQKDNGASCLSSRRGHVNRKMFLFIWMLHTGR